MPVQARGHGNSEENRGPRGTKGRAERTFLFFGGGGASHGILPGSHEMTDYRCSSILLLLVN